MYQPFGAYSITCNWDCHRARGSLGGTDRAMGVGTNLPACAASTVTFIPNNGTGGHTTNLKHTDGTSTQYMHCSQFVGAGGRKVAEREVVAKSGGAKGAAGAGQSTGPHLHAHSYVGSKRVPAFYEGMTTGGGGGIPTILEADMSYSIVKQAGSANILLVSLITGNSVTIGSPQHVTFLQRLKKSNNDDPMYGSELTICAGYLRLANPNASMDIDALVKKIDAADDEETEAILTAISQIPAGGGGGGGASAAEVAKAVDAILADDFAKVNANIDDQPTEFTVSPNAEPGKRV